MKRRGQTTICGEVKESQMPLAPINPPPNIPKHPYTILLSYLSCLVMAPGRRTRAGSSGGLLSSYTCGPTSPPAHSGSVAPFFHSCPCLYQQPSTQGRQRWPRPSLGPGCMLLPFGEARVGKRGSVSVCVCAVVVVVLVVVVKWAIRLCVCRPICQCWRGCLQPGGEVAVFTTEGLFDGLPARASSAQDDAPPAR